MARRRRRSKKGKLSLLLGILLAAAFSAYCLAAVSNEFDFTLLPPLEGVGAGLFGGKPADAENDCEVHFIDVGQGDSALILCGGKTVLIDGGENDQGRGTADYLKGLGIGRIDLLLATHPHSDHIGGLDTVVRELEIGAVVTPHLPDELVPTTRTYTDFLTAIAEKGLKITAAKPGAAYAFGAGTLTILGPSADFPDLNDTSLVCKFTFDGRSFLFTGDMEAPAERKLLEDGADLQADVLKLGHHGSATSTSREFYEAVDPSVCIVSCGEGNSYGHPSAETLETAASNGAAVYRTDSQGSIVVGIADGEWRMTTEKGGGEGKIAA